MHQQAIQEERASETFLSQKFVVEEEQISEQASVAEQIGVEYVAIATEVEEKSHSDIFLTQKLAAHEETISGDVSLMQTLSAQEDIKSDISTFTQKLSVREESAASEFSLTQIESGHIEATSLDISVRETFGPMKGVTSAVHKESSIEQTRYVQVEQSHFADISLTHGIHTEEDTSLPMRPPRKQKQRGKDSTDKELAIKDQGPPEDSLITKKEALAIESGSLETSMVQIPSILEKKVPSKQFPKQQNVQSDVSLPDAIHPDGQTFEQPIITQKTTPLDVAQSQFSTLKDPGSPSNVVLSQSTSAEEQVTPLDGSFPKKIGRKWQKRPAHLTEVPRVISIEKPASDDDLVSQGKGFKSPTISSYQEGTRVQWPHLPIPLAQKSQKQQSAISDSSESHKVTSGMPPIPGVQLQQTSPPGAMLPEKSGGKEQAGPTDVSLIKKDTTEVESLFPGTSLSQGLGAKEMTEPPTILPRKKHQLKTKGASDDSSTIPPKDDAPLHLTLDIEEHYTPISSTMTHQLIPQDESSDTLLTPRVEPIVGAMSPDVSVIHKVQEQEQQTKSDISRTQKAITSKRSDVEMTQKITAVEQAGISDVSLTQKLSKEKSSSASFTSMKKVEVTEQTAASFVSLIHKSGVTEEITSDNTVMVPKLSAVEETASSDISLTPKLTATVQDRTVSLPLTQKITAQEESASVDISVPQMLSATDQSPVMVQKLTDVEKMASSDSSVDQSLSAGDPYTSSHVAQKLSAEVQSTETSVPMIHKLTAQEQAVSQDVSLTQKLSVQEETISEEVALRQKLKAVDQRKGSDTSYSVKLVEDAKTASGVQPVKQPSGIDKENIDVPHTLTDISQSKKQTIKEQSPQSDISVSKNLETSTTMEGAQLGQTLIKKDQKGLDIISLSGTTMPPSEMTVSPPVKVQQPLEDVSVNEEECLTFSCILSATDLSVTWLKDGIELTPNDNLKMTQAGYNYNLTLTRVTPPDAGEYILKCGEVEYSKAKLTVKGKF